MPSSFPLLDLPAELRIRVYEHIFDLRNDQGRLHYHEDRYGVFDLSKYPAGICALDLSARGMVKSCSLGEARLQSSPLRNFTAILQTAGFINKEATDVLFAQTCFRIVCASSHPTGSRLLCASRNACFNFRHTTIYHRSIVQLLRQVQNVDLSMNLEREGQILDLLPAVDVLLSILNLSRKQKSRTFRITLAEWLPFFLDTIDPWTWRDIIGGMKGMEFACSPVTQAHAVPAEDEPKYIRLREFVDVTGGVLEVNTSPTG